MFQYRHGLNTLQQMSTNFIFTEYMFIYFLRLKLLLWNTRGKTELHIGLKESLNSQDNGH